MTQQYRPLIPVNPQGLDDIAEGLLNTSSPNVEANDFAPNKNGFIYVPSINLYVSKERTLQNKNWNDTHKEVLRNGLGRMPTPNETWELIKYAKANLSNPELKNVYDDILKTTPQNTWHGEWQNAKFSEDKKIKYVQRVISLDKQGELVYSPRERLDDYLIEDCWAEFNSTNKQGLLTRKHSSLSYAQGQNIYFYHPRNNSVARFGANSDGAYLNCGGNPSYSYSALGVRLVREATPRKIPQYNFNTCTSSRDSNSFIFS